MEKMAEAVAAGVAVVARTTKPGSYKIRLMPVLSSWHAFRYGVVYQADIFVSGGE
jgi:hypothetical protein